MAIDKPLPQPGNLIGWAGGDRAMLAIVFTDIVGSTAMELRLGGELMDEVRHAHFARSDALIAQLGGRQVKTIGDSVMALFRSAGPAFDYALALHLDPGHDELRKGGIRAGIHSGEVRVVENDVFGSAVNFAARVAHAIEGAEIWLSGQVCEALTQARARHHRGMEWLQHDDIELKGFGKYPLWSLQMSIPPAEAPISPVAQPLPAPVRRDAAAPRSGLESTIGHVSGASPNGRIVFIARPAPDMGNAYVRIVDELKARGFAVRPECDIPDDDGAEAFIDAALAEAELSIHLLGERHGKMPDAEGARPIVDWQLERAKLRCQRADAGGTGAPGFARIIWAPKFIEGVAQAQIASAERDPFAVLARFGESLSADNVTSENLIQFTTFLHQYLNKTRPKANEDRIEIHPGAKIFIDHAVEDIDYAIKLIRVLKQLSLVPRVPVLDGKPSTRTAQNRRYMEECDVVALCWGNTTEAWVTKEASVLYQWRQNAQLNRIKATLLAGPPVHKIKERALHLNPPGIDAVVNMTAIEDPSPEDLREWVQAQAENVAAPAGPN